MNRVRPFLLVALVPILASCGPVKKDPPALVASRVNCSAFEGPPIDPPRAPPPGSKDVVLWQLNAVGWQLYSEAILGQRVDTARCLLQSWGVVP